MKKKDYMVNLIGGWKWPVLVSATTKEGAIQEAIERVKCGYADRDDMIIEPPFHQDTWPVWSFVDEQKPRKKAKKAALKSKKIKA